MLIWSYLTWSNLIASKLYLSIDLSIYLSSIFVCLSIYLSIDLSTGIWNEAILRNFLKMDARTAPKRSDSARLPQKVQVHSSKTMTFRETSSFFALENVKNEANRSNSKRIWSKMDSWVQNWRPRANAFCDCFSPCRKSARGYGTKRIWR